MRRQGCGAGGCNTQQPQCAGRGGRDLLCVQDPLQLGLPWALRGGGGGHARAPRGTFVESVCSECGAGSGALQGAAGHVLVAGQARVT